MRRRTADVEPRILSHRHRYRAVAVFGLPLTSPAPPRWRRPSRLPRRLVSSLFRATCVGTVLAFYVARSQRPDVGRSRRADVPFPDQRPIDIGQLLLPWRNSSQPRDSYSRCRVRRWEPPPPYPNGPSNSRCGRVPAPGAASPEWLPPYCRFQPRQPPAARTWTAASVSPIFPLPARPRPARCRRL